MKKKAKKQIKASTTPCDPSLDATLAISYSQLRDFFPDLSEDKWLQLKDIALDNSMTELIEFTEQVRRHSQVEPDGNVKIGGLVTVLEKILSVFKIQRAIIEELKEAVSTE